MAQQKSIKANALWNLIGVSVPLLVGVVTVPLIIDAAGVERFGLLSIAWILIGYFGLFDVGISRALTKLVSEKLYAKEIEKCQRLVSTGLLLVAMLGLTGGLIIFSASEVLATQVLNLPDALVAEAVSTMRILSMGIPFVAITAVFIGVLEATRNFEIIAQLRIPTGSFLFAAPAISTLFSPKIDTAVLLIVFVRFITMLVYFYASKRSTPEIWVFRRFRWVEAKQLLSFGGWMTITRVVGPIITYSDRFLLGALGSIRSVTFYTTPYDVISRAQIFPYTLMGVILPEFSESAKTQPERVRSLYKKSLRALIFIVFPFFLFAFLFANELLFLWLGSEFAMNSTAVARALLYGFLVNILAFPAFTLCLGSGRPDLVAKTHLLELPVYLIILYLGIQNFGLVGAGLAWAVRALVDTSALILIAARIQPSIRSYTIPLLVAIFGVGVAFYCLTFLENPTLRLSLWVIVSFVCLFQLWEIIGGRDGIRRLIAGGPA